MDSCFQKAFFLFCFSLVCLPLYAQQPYPQDYFRSPLDTTLLLSAPFGQLRDNHFHSGLDIRTFEKEGLPVYAVADGWLSRIKVSPFGYGKALYIDHPNGYTSVYAHLKCYNDSIRAYVKKEQYAKETFDIELFPHRQQIPVKKGDLIAYSGNSGGSTGPHLHFEIRNSRTEYPINPLLFNLPVTDSLSPFFKSLAIYNLMPNRPLPILQKKFKNLTPLSGPNILLLSDTLLIPRGLIGFGVEVYDYISDNDREQNIYSLQLRVDSIPYYDMNIETFSFNDTKYINTHIDYDRLVRDRVRIQKCFIDDGNKMDIYDRLPFRGKYFLNDTLIHEAEITAYDRNGNKCLLHFYLKGTAESLSAGSIAECSYERFAPSGDHTFAIREVRVDIPRGSLYDTLDFCYKAEPATRHTLSRIFTAGDVYTPLNSSFTISIRPDKKDSLLFPKMLIAKVSAKGSLSSVGGSYVNGWVSGYPRSFGDFTIAADSLAPKIKFLKLLPDTFCTDSFRLSIYAEDNLSGIDHYRLLMNGRWVLLDFDAKSGLFTYEFDENTPRNQSVLFEFTVSDRKKNQAKAVKKIFIP